jgi:hypothetical protein
MYGIRSKLECMSKSVKVTDNNKYKRAYCVIYQIPVHYAYMMFYSTGPLINKYLCMRSKRFCKC